MIRSRFSCAWLSRICWCWRAARFSASCSNCSSSSAPELYSRQRLAWSMSRCFCSSRSRRRISICACRDSSIVRANAARFSARMRKRSSSSRRASAISFSRRLFCCSLSSASRRTPCSMSSFRRRCLASSIFFICRSWRTLRSAFACAYAAIFASSAASFWACSALSLRSSSLALTMAYWLSRACCSFRRWSSAASFSAARAAARIA
mmetsp:Transcript_14816/g.37473  ORF Transcript_14816/g.37473 Transcript_14816/m.37473 type:complete len:207 (+) Transcript_14816:258-878(+)